MLEMSTPFIVSIFCGKSKPNDVKDFLFDFLNEYRQLNDNGFLYEGVKYFVKIKSFVCDDPAREFLKCVKSHNGYFSCERCTVKGTWEGRVVFEEVNCPSRNEIDFQNMEYLGSHQMARTPLIDFNIDCIQSFSLDYMHLVCLGVVKRLLLFLPEGPRICKLSSTHISQMSDKLVSLNGTFPSEFVRQPRSLSDLKRWKATEFRQFLLYSGIVVLKNVLTKSCYHHFLSLPVAMSILLDPDCATKPDYLDYARSLLVFFVSKAKLLYGATFTSYNIHSLIHLHEDVINFNTDGVSCFPFENYLQVLKKFVRTSHNPIAQVGKRIIELENAGSHINHKNIKTKVSTNQKDSWFLLNNGDYACIKDIRNNGEFSCDIIHPIHIQNLFTEPCESKCLNIGVVSKGWFTPVA